MSKKYKGLETVFPIFRDEAEHLEMFPEVTQGRSISFLMREKGCVSLFIKETTEEESLSPRCFGEEDYIGSTADGRAVVLRILDCDIEDVTVGIFVSSEATTTEEIQRAISKGEKPLFYRAVVA